MLRTGLLLGLFAAVGTGLIAVIHAYTRTRIAANERAVLLRELHKILPESLYDNDLANSMIMLHRSELGAQTEALPAYLATNDGKPSAIIFTVLAPDGYGGPIKLLVGIDAHGVVSGVRVISHRETPGLGDWIDTRHGDWILGFTGHYLGDPPLQGWAVRRDGGEFDQFTGATITPRAVVGGIRRTLLYFREHHEELFALRTENPPDTR